MTSPKPKSDTPLSIAEVLAAKKRTIVPVDITLDDQAGTTATFKFASIGRAGWEKVLDDHQATDEQQAEHRHAQVARDVPQLLITSLRWNRDTFPPALIAASCIEPEMTVAQAQALWDDPAWSAVECNKLFESAKVANDPLLEETRASLGKDSPSTTSSATSSPPATTT